MPYDNCNECPHYKKDSCPLSALSDRLKQQFCPFLKLRLIDPAPIQKRFDVVDYSRNDTGGIAHRFDPNLN